MMFFNFYMKALSDLMSATAGRSTLSTRESADPKEEVETPPEVVQSDVETAETPVQRKKPLARPRLVAVNGELVAPSNRLGGQTPKYRQRPLRVVQ
jgi:hypothetical protein